MKKIISVSICIMFSLVLSAIPKDSLPKDLILIYPNQVRTVNTPGTGVNVIKSDSLEVLNQPTGNLIEAQKETSEYYANKKINEMAAFSIVVIILFIVLVGILRKINKKKLNVKVTKDTLDNDKTSENKYL